MARWKEVLAKRRWLLHTATLLVLTGACFSWAEGQAVSDSTYAVRTEYNVMVPMRDGVRLSTDIHRPDAEGPFPVVLTRTPYWNGSYGWQVQRGRWWASRGYVFLEQDVRGRYDSEGSWYPFFREAEDGHDAIEWAARQPWSDGRVGMFGASYMGHVQWQAAAKGSPHLTAIAPMVPILSLYHEIYIGGALRLSLFAKWAMKNMNRTNQEAPFDWDRELKALPLIDLDRRLGASAPFWQDIVEHPSYDAYWAPLNVATAFENVTAPTLNLGGWYDIFLKSTLNGYLGMRERGGTDEARAGQKLVIGPWDHLRRADEGEIDYGEAAKIDGDIPMLRWMDHWLKGVDNGVMDAPVSIFVMGDNRWRDELEWPLARTRYTRFHLTSGGGANSLHGDGVLRRQSAEGAETDTYVYDPDNPVPTCGGNVLHGLTAGAHDQREVEARQDVLCYTSAPLDADTEVTGPITASLYAASSARDTDFTVKLVDVHPDGRAYNLADGIIRARYRESLSAPTLIEPGKVYEYTVDLWATSNVFKKGHRIRVDVSSSNFPRFDRNPNTGDVFGMETEVVKATQTLYHTRRYPSHITLPIIPR